MRGQRSPKQIIRVLVLLSVECQPTLASGFQVPLLPTIGEDRALIAVQGGRWGQAPREVEAMIVTCQRQGLQYFYPSSSSSKAGLWLVNPVYAPWKI